MIVVDFIAGSGYFRLSVCAWGIFLAYIRHRPSSRLCFYVFWEAARDRIFLVSESGLLKKDLALTCDLR